MFKYLLIVNWQNDVKAKNLRDWNLKVKELKDDIIVKGHNLLKN